MKSLHLLISGRVQRVWYRDWMVGPARASAIDGWVRNTADGCVEALVSGEAACVDRLVEACRGGPERACVSGIAISPAAAPDQPGFDRIADA